MKRLITLLLATSLSLAAVANAAQEDPKARKSAKTGPVQKQQVAPKQHVVGPKQNFTPKSSNVAMQVNSPKKNVNVNKPVNVNTTTPVSSKVHSRTTSKNLKSIKKEPVIQSNQLPAVQKNQKNVIANQKNIVAPNTKPIPNVQNIQAKYKNFKAQPKPAVIPSAQFNQNYQIAGAQNWSGPQYQVFSSYRPQWRDQGWWRSNYGASLLLIGGGWYYWNAGYWYPAWGYDSAYSYYPYDGPIYAGQQRRPFDEVVADVQASLQEQGYYHGEVDGLMGPQTREALAGFQRDHGLITTAALDQPTLASLGLG